MAAKEIVYSEDCRQAILRGVNKLAEAVRSLSVLAAGTSSSRRSSAPHQHQGRRHRGQGDRARRSQGEHGRPASCARSPARPRRRG